MVPAITLLKGEGRLGPSVSRRSGATSLHPGSESRAGDCRRVRRNIRCCQGQTRCTRGTSFEWCMPCTLFHDLVSSCLVHGLIARWVSLVPRYSNNAITALLGFENCDGSNHSIDSGAENLVVKHLTSKTNRASPSGQNAGASTLRYDRRLRCRYPRGPSCDVQVFAAISRWNCRHAMT